MEKINIQGCKKGNTYPPEGARGASARGWGLRLSLWPPSPQLQQMKETRRLFPDKSVYTHQIGPGLCFGALALMLRFFFEVLWEGVGKEPPTKAMVSPSLLGPRLGGHTPPGGSSSSQLLLTRAPRSIAAWSFPGTTSTSRGGGYRQLAFGWCTALKEPHLEEGGRGRRGKAWGEEPHPTGKAPVSQHRPAVV